MYLFPGAWLKREHCQSNFVLDRREWTGKNRHFISKNSINDLHVFCCLFFLIFSPLNTKKSKYFRIGYYLLFSFCVNLIFALILLFSLNINDWLLCVLYILHSTSAKNMFTCTGGLWFSNAQTVVLSFYYKDGRIWTTPKASGTCLHLCHSYSAYIMVFGSCYELHIISLHIGLSLFCCF